MYDSQIQSAKTVDLERVLGQLARSTAAGQIDLAVRIAKELRYRRIHSGDRKNKENS